MISQIAVSKKEKGRVEIKIVSNTNQLALIQLQRSIHDRIEFESKKHHPQEYWNHVHEQQASALLLETLVHDVSKALMHWIVPTWQRMKFKTAQELGEERGEREWTPKIRSLRDREIEKRGSMQRKQSRWKEDKAGEPKRSGQKNSQTRTRMRQDVWIYLFMENHQPPRSSTLRCR